MLNNNLLNESLQETKDLICLFATYYYRWSKSAQLKERKFIDNKLLFEEKQKIIEEHVLKLKNAINEYKQYCPKCGKTVRLTLVGDGYLDKGESGAKVEREDIDRLCQDGAKAAFSVVVTPYSSRLGRRTSVSSTIRDKLKDLGIQIFSIHQPITVKCTNCFDQWQDDSTLLMESMSDISSEMEYRQIRRNYAIGMRIRTKGGLPTGSLPYGLVKKFRKIGVDSKGNDVMEFYYEWDKKKTDIVNRIAEEFLSGLGAWKISQRLNEDNIPSPQSKLWGRSAILTILRNPSYYGIVRFGWKPVKNGKRVIQPKDKWLIQTAVYEGIWKEDYFKTIQSEIARRATVGGRAVSSNGLLIGLLKCWYCKYSMYQAKGAKTFKNGKQYAWRGYACGGNLHKGICQHNGKKQSLVDRLVLREVLKLANDDTRKSFYLKLSQSKQKDLTELLKQKRQSLEKLNTEYDRITLAYMKSVFTLEEFSSHKKQILPAIERLQKESKELEVRLTKTPEFSWEKRYEDIINKFLNYPTTEDKRTVKSILNRLIERAEIRSKPLYIKIFYRAVS